jgi:serine carboxypeptidase-like clade 2
MNYTVSASWAPWTAVDGTLGGYVTEYAPTSGRFVFASIRGAGHMVPQTQPQYAWELTNKWVTGQSLT